MCLALGWWTSGLAQELRAQPFDERGPFLVDERPQRAEWMWASKYVAASATQGAKRGT